MLLDPSTDARQDPFGTALAGHVDAQVIGIPTEAQPPALQLALQGRELGSFLTGIPAPLGLGKVELANGRWETGFICDAYGLAGAEDITAFGGWRAWLQAR